MVSHITAFSQVPIQQNIHCRAVRGEILPLGQNLGNENDVTELKWLLLSPVTSTDVLNVLLSHSFGHSEKLGFAGALYFMVVFWLKGSGEESSASWPGEHRG